MSEKLKSKISLSLTMKEVEWLYNILVATANKAKEEARATSSESIREVHYRDHNNAANLMDRIDSERY